MNLILGRNDILKNVSISEDLEDNLAKLLKSLNTFRPGWGHPLWVTSGYRTPEHNKAIGGRANSAHLYCMAADIADPDGSLAKFCLQNEEWLAQCGLWMEDPSYTPHWIHLTIRPPASGHRIFIP